MPSHLLARRAASLLAPVLAASSPVWAQAPAPTPVSTPAPAPATLALTSTTHADALVRDFSDGQPGFAPYSVPGGVPSGATPRVVNGALRIVNAHPGSFGMSANMAPFDALKYGTLAFDYKVGPGVKVNIFLRIKGKYHGIVFCGPDRMRPGAVKLGKIEDVKLDNAWHRAIVPVRALLQKLYPQDEALNVDEIIVGNWDNTGYLVAGFGGNPAGATYWLDNWSFVGARSPEKAAKFQITNATGAPLSYTLDFDAPKPLKGKSLEISPADGFHVLSVSRAGKAGKAGKGAASASFPFLMSGAAPTAGAPRLANNMIEVPISDSAPLDVRGARVSVGGQSFDVAQPDLARPAHMQVDAAHNGAGAVVRVAVGAAGMKFSNGQSVPVEVTLKDALGRAVSGGKSAVKVDFAQQEAPPPAPVVQFERSGKSWDWDGSFERNTGGWTSAGSDGAIIERDASTSADGDYSLRFTSPSNAATFRSELARTSPSVDSFPIVSFDYKATPDLRMDFLVACAGVIYRVAWTDKGDRPYPVIGEVPNVKANGTWQHAEFNLAEMLRKVKPDLKEITLDWFAMSDSGWLGNARGVQFWLDNFRMVPIEKAPSQAQVLVDDVTGVQAVAYSIDAKTDASVDLSHRIAGDKVAISGKGREYLHLRVQNGAGKWSAPVHLPLLIDSSPPTITAQLPADNTDASPAAQVWTVAEGGDVDTSALAIEVNGQIFKAGDASISFDRRVGALTWNPLQAMAQSKFGPLQDGARVNWKLTNLQDRAGNSGGSRAGSWTWRRALDKLAPSAAVSSPTHPVLQFDTFEPGPSAPSTMGTPREADVVSIVEGAEPGGHALRVTASGNSAPLWISARREAWDVSKFPVACFRYRVSPKVANLSLRLNLPDDRSWNVRLKGEANDSLGRIKGTGLKDAFENDGKWHWAQVNLAEMLKRDNKTTSPMVASLDILDPMRVGKVQAAVLLPAGATSAPVGAQDVWFEIDDFALCAPGAGEVKVAWAAYDLAGVEGFRVAWDQKPDTVPTEEAADGARTLRGEAGVHFLHVQARDKAGNVGAPTHFPVVVR